MSDDAWELFKHGDALALEHPVRNYHEAEDFLRQALMKFRIDRDKKGEATSLDHIGMLYTTNGDHEGAISLHKESLAISRESGDREGEVRSLDFLGELTKSVDVDEARCLFQKSLAINIEIGDREGEAKSIRDLSTCAPTIDEAETYLRQCLTIHREIGNKLGEVGSLMDLGHILHIHSDLGNDLVESERLYREGLRIAREFGFKHCQASILSSLSDIMGIRGEEDVSELLQREANEIMSLL